MVVEPRRRMKGLDVLEKTCQHEYLYSFHETMIGFFCITRRLEGTPA